jgi:hypothetical protein
MKFEPGQLVKFKACETNTGAVTINGKVLHLHKNGKPIKAGELVAGQVIEFDCNTGEVK